MNNNKFTQIISPLIFTKKVNDKFNIVPLNIISNTLGQTKHFPSATKEWFNSIYAYNNNSIKNLTIADKNLIRLIKSYFNLYFNNKILKSKRISTRFRRFIMNKIFVSRAELKHTSSKVIITLYVYNQQRRDLLDKIQKIENLLFPYSEGLISKEKSRRLLSLEDKLNIIQKKKEDISLKNWFIGLQLSIVEQIKLEENIYFASNSLKLKNNKKLILEKLNKNLKDLLYIINLCENDPISYTYYEKFYTEFLHKTHLDKEIKIIAYYKLLLNLNKFKFEENFILKLKPLIVEIYNKDIEFNIVNLKTLYLNSDIFTQVIALKLKNRNNKLLSILNSSLSMFKLPNISRIGDNYSYLNVKELWANRVKGLKISSIIDKNSFFLDKSNKDLLNKVLLTLFPNSSFVVKYGEVLSENKTSNVLLKYILNSLKHKNMAGLRLEAKGRLTRRFTASRSVFKIKWKGSLKNIDSSYRGLSSIILRGYKKSNVQYSIVNSKTRNGAFGLKGWISSK